MAGAGLSLGDTKKPSCPRHLRLQKYRGLSLGARGTRRGMGGRVPTALLCTDCVLRHSHTSFHLLVITATMAGTPMLTLGTGTLQAQEAW